MNKTLAGALLTGIVALAAAAPAQATPITIQLNVSPTLQGGVAKFHQDTVDAFDLRIAFDTVTAPFTVDITANDTPDLSNLPPGYTCVPIQGGNTCIMFTITPSANNWSGFYNITISWIADTNALYPNQPVDPLTGLGQVRIFHFSSTTGLTDITTPNSYCTTGGPDPAIGGRDDNFSDFIVAQQVNPVPEPASLLLFGSGAGLLAFVLRRRYRVAK